MASIPEIRTEMVDGVCKITLCRSSKKNAVTAAMYTALTEALLNAADSAQVKIVRLAGEGGVFTAGNDLGDFLANPPQAADAPVFRFIETAAFFEKPLLAVVDGLAVGIGTTLLLHCDYVVAAPATRFRLPFVNLGLCPEAASSYLLPLRAGYALAADLLLTGRFFDAATALRAGLVNVIATDDTLQTEAQRYCEQLVAQPSAALRATKSLLKAAHKDQVRATLVAEQTTFLRRLASPEAKEAFTAFAEKRAPDFSRFG